MSDLNISIAKPTNFESLTILICHLLIGGNFRVAHVFNDPNWADCPSVNAFWCADKVLWQKSDISLARNQDNHTSGYKTLEMIFLYSPESVQHVQKHSRNYRYFIFIKNNASSMDPIENFIEYEMSSTAKESLILIYYTHNESTAVYLPQTIRMDPVYIQNRGLTPAASKSNVIYRKITGEMDKLWMIGVSYPNDNKCLTYKVYRTKIFMFVSKLFANFFYDRLNMDFVQHTQFRCAHAKKDIANVRHKFSTIYRELSKQTVPLDNVTM